MINVHGKVKLRISSMKDPIRSLVYLKLPQLPDGITTD